MLWSLNGMEVTTECHETTIWSGFQILRKYAYKKLERGNGEWEKGKKMLENPPSQRMWSVIGSALIRSMKSLLNRFQGAKSSIIVFCLDLNLWSRRFTVMVLWTAESLMNIYTKIVQRFRLFKVNWILFSHWSNRFDVLLLWIASIWNNF